MQFKWKNVHSRAKPLAAKCRAYLFFRLKMHNMGCYFHGLGHKMTGCFCLEVAIGLLAGTRLEYNTEIARLAAQSWLVVM